MKKTIIIILTIIALVYFEITIDINEIVKNQKFYFGTLVSLMIAFSSIYYWRKKSGSEVADEKIKSELKLLEEKTNNKFEKIEKKIDDNFNTSQNTMVKTLNRIETGMDRSMGKITGQFVESIKLVTEDSRKTRQFFSDEMLKLSREVADVAITATNAVTTAAINTKTINNVVKELKETRAYLQDRIDNKNLTKSWKNDLDDFALSSLKDIQKIATTREAIKSLNQKYLMFVKFVVESLELMDSENNKKILFQDIKNSFNEKSTSIKLYMIGYVGQEFTDFFYKKHEKESAKYLKVIKKIISDKRNNIKLRFHTLSMNFMENFLDLYAQCLEENEDMIRDFLKIAPKNDKINKR